MTNLNSNLLVSVASDAPPVGSQGFGTVLCVAAFTTAESTAFGVRSKAYESSKEASEDADLTSAGKAMVAAAFSQASVPSQVKVGVYVVGDDADYGAALAAIDAVDGSFYGVCIESRVKADILSAAAWVEANNRFGNFQSSDAEFVDAADTTDVASTMQSASRARSKVDYHAVDGEFEDVSTLAYFLSANPDTTSTIMSYQTLSGVTVNTMTSTEKQAVLSKNGSVYLPFMGSPATYGGTMASGLKSDVRLSIDWLTSRVKEAQAQALLNATARKSKIPFTDEGFAVFQALTMAILIQGEAAGHFIPGSSFCKVPKRASVTNADASSRVLRYTFGAVLAGAVETVEVDGTVSVDQDLIASLAV